MTQQPRRYLKSQLVMDIAARHPGLPAEVVRHVLECFLGGVSGALATGKRVELRGFGTFSTRRHEARVARNPRTGEVVHAPARNHIQFRTGILLHTRINQKPSS